MGKTKNNGQGFPSTNRRLGKHKQNTKKSAEHSKQEQHALDLINQGKLQEAKAVYKELIAAGTKNHVSYGNLAAIHGMQGQWRDVIAILNQAIEIMPNYADAHNNLGNALREQGDIIAAIGSYNKAIELNPKHPDAHYNLGNALREHGDLNAAAASYTKGLEQNSNSPDIHYCLGDVMMEQGDINGAIASYNKVIKLNPNHTEAFLNLGVALIKYGDIPAAIASYRKVLELKPKSPDAHNNLGNALAQQRQIDAAIASYVKALEIEPKHPDAHNNLGNAIAQKGDIVAAIRYYNKALELKPKHPDAHNNLGNALVQQGEIAAAIASYSKAIELMPNHSDAHNNLGNTLIEQGDIKGAITCYGKAIEIKPNDSDAYNNMGNALVQQGDFNAAISSYNKAIEVDPNHPDAHWNSSLTLLLSGDYKAGWEKYEWRANLTKNAYKPHASPQCSKWDGKALRPREKLLLVSEQGLGDTLQFMRYAIFLKEQGIDISLCAQPKLHNLIAASGIADLQLTTLQANQVIDGHWIPLLSLPRHLNISPENPIITEPYIKTTQELTDKWEKILSAEQRPVIGINWQGKPTTEKTSLKGRSLPLENFASIANKTNATLLSLQKGFGSEQLDTCSFKNQFVSCQEQINQTWDFLETAAIIANCDLVITNDTSVAHLAGGMGKTTWLLLHKVPDWRWGIKGDDTFWYPSMRLFRQSESGKWGEILERVAEELQKYFKGLGDATQKKSSPKTIAKRENTQNILVPISLGKLIDKITILEIKLQHLAGTAHENAENELLALKSAFKKLHLSIDPTIIHRLRQINLDLWQTKDSIHKQVRQKAITEDLVNLVILYYHQSDVRETIKKEINTSYNSPFPRENWQ